MREKFAIASGILPARTYRSPRVLIVVRSPGSALTTLRYSSIGAGILPCKTYFSAVRSALDLLSDIPAWLLIDQGAGLSSREATCRSSTQLVKTALHE